MVHISKGGNGGPDYSGLLLIFIFVAAIAVPVILWLAALAPYIGLILILASLIIGYFGYSNNSQDTIVLALVLFFAGLILIVVGIKTTDWFNTDPNAKAWRNMSNETLGGASQLFGLGLTLNLDNLNYSPPYS